MSVKEPCSFYEQCDHLEKDGATCNGFGRYIFFGITKDVCYDYKPTLRKIERIEEESLFD